jgi:hypothetical protein
MKPTQPGLLRNCPGRKVVPLIDLWSSVFNVTGGLLGCKPEDTERVRGTFNRYGNAAEVGLQAQHDKPAALSMPPLRLRPVARQKR